MIDNENEQNVKKWTNEKQVLAVQKASLPVACELIESLSPLLLTSTRWSENNSFAVNRQKSGTFLLIHQQHYFDN